MSDILFGYEECDPDHRCSACAARYAPPPPDPHSTRTIELEAEIARLKTPVGINESLKALAKADDYSLALDGLCRSCGNGLPCHCENDE